MHNDAHPPYSRGPMATTPAKKPCTKKSRMGRFLPYIMACVGVAPTPDTVASIHGDALAREPVPKLKQAPALKQPEAAYMPPNYKARPTESESEAEPEPEVHRTVKGCQRSFRHRSCRLNHPGQCRRLRDIVEEKGNDFASMFRPLPGAPAIAYCGIIAAPP
ncbi:hypothetical protein B0T16DRAFT_460588 [Cercophora newfieldiana]|uniref:Uncharacterized protein n=1 Tax=Cercophora newfieldiana TaxID=92897 RepID=A0AA39Y2H7_9PEZI|nr:hypothetical protein B0T16DRAFT_460588 [Cercophora newfieldiana]